MLSWAPVVSTIGALFTFSSLHRLPLHLPPQNPLLLHPRPAGAWQSRCPRLFPAGGESFPMGEELNILIDHFSGKTGKPGYGVRDFAA